MPLLTALAPWTGPRWGSSRRSSLSPFLLLGNRHNRHPRFYTGRTGVLRNARHDPCRKARPQQENKRPVVYTRNAEENARRMWRPDHGAVHRDQRSATFSFFTGFLVWLWGLIPGRWFLAPSLCSDQLFRTADVLSAWISGEQAPARARYLRSHRTYRESLVCRHVFTHLCITITHFSWLLSIQLHYFRPRHCRTQTPPHVRSRRLNRPLRDPKCHRRLIPPRSW